MEAREGGAGEVRRKERQGLGEGWGAGEEGRKKWETGRGKGGESCLCGPLDWPLRTH